MSCSLCCGVNYSISRAAVTLLFKTSDKIDARRNRLISIHAVLDLSPHYFFICPHSGGHTRLPVRS